MIILIKVLLTGSEGQLGFSIKDLKPKEIQLVSLNKNQFDLPNSTAHVTKVMSSHPRRISKIIIEINFEKNNLSEQNVEKLIAVAKGCPVAQSLSSDLIQEVRFNF